MYIALGEKSMEVIQPISDQSIIDCLNKDYSLPVITLTLLPLGADMDGWVYQATAHNQSSFFVKLKRGHHHDIPIALVALLHHAGIQEIISPIKTTHGQWFQHMGEYSLIVYPFIEGQNGFSRALSNQQWFTLGKVLRQLHGIELPSSIEKGIRRETFSPEWRERVRSLYNAIETIEIVDEVAIKLLASMKNNEQAIHRLVDQAEFLAKILQNELPPFVLCHSDIHAGNILIAENNSMYIVDWDEPIMAPKERDLMFIGGGVGNVWNIPSEEAIFYQGYRETTINKKLLAYYRNERIVEDIALYGQAILSTTSESKDKHVMLAHYTDMFEPQGVIEIALNTDDGLAL
jgi:spectinomycin phosphotransferase